MKRTYKKKSNLINRTGYTPGYSTEKNPVNFIPSESITMANTPYPLKATPLDQNGNPMGDSVVMQPGEEYRFGGASYVAETPMFGKGGEKGDWISAKISTLVKEGYPQKQAVAIAYEMYDNVHKDGGYQLPMYQTAGKYSFGNTFAGSNFAKPKFGADPNIKTPEQFSEEMKKASDERWGQYSVGKDPNKSEDPFALTAGQDFKKRTDEIGKAAGLPQTMSPNIFGAEVEDSKPKTEGNQPFQFFNPYSGVDIPTAGVMFGQSLENKDTLGAIASGAKVALGTARNILGGMGQARRENYVKQQYAEKQREGMTGQGKEEMKKFGGYYQEGGMEQSQGKDIQQQVAQALQQGMSPEEVMQQLIQMGMSEEQAVGLIQSLMQQMQPSTPQLKRGGMMYYQDGGEEDEYGYEDEEEPNYMINKPSLMGKRQNFSEPALAISPAIESAVETTSSTKEEEETPSYAKNSARDTWVAKTGMPWSEAKRLGYTSGSAKDNMKLLSELNDPRFKKEYLRTKPLSPAKKQAVKTAVKPAPKTKPTSIYEYFGTNKESLQKKGESYRKANQIQTPKEGNFITRTGEILANPLQSLSHYSKYKELPAEGFSKNNKNAYDQVIGIANPFYWANALGNAADYAGEGEYSKAAVESLDALPALGKVKYTKYIPFPKGLPPASVRRAGYLEQGAKRLGMEEGGYYQYGGDYDTYNEKDFKDNDIVRHSGGNTGLTKSELNSLAKQYKMSPQEFLNIISYGEPGEGMSSKYELSVKGSDKYLPKNWRETYKQNKTSTTGFRGALNKGLDYIGVDPIFNMGGYYQDGGEQQVAQQAAQALQQGAQPEQVMQMLLESGMTQDQAVRLVQAIMQQVQQQSGTEEGTPQMRRGGYHQEGGMQPAMEEQGGQGNEMEAIMQQVAQMLQQGADPQQVLQQLVEMGIPEEQAMQMIQGILQEIQGGETDMEEPEEGTPQMSKGGKYMRALVGKTIKNYTYNPKTDSYIVSYE
jgi:hypothetical protein